MSKPEKTMIAVTDARKAALFSCGWDAKRRLVLEPVSQLQNPWEHEHEHGRPSVLGRGPSANASQHFASLGHEPEEEKQRFAREVATWLKAAPRSATRLVVFAAPGFIGRLRVECREPNVDLRECELTRLTPDELTRHTAVLEALTPAHGLS